MSDKSSREKKGGAPVGVARVFLASLAGIALFAALALVLTRRPDALDELEAERAGLRSEKLAALRAREADALGRFAWEDRERGTARIPVARAMALAVERLAQKRPVPAGLVNPPPPPPPPPPVAAPAMPAAPSGVSPVQMPVTESGPLPVPGAASAPGTAPGTAPAVAPGTAPAPSGVVPVGGAGSTKNIPTGGSEKKSEGS